MRQPISITDATLRWQGSDDSSTFKFHCTVSMSPSRILDLRHLGRSWKPSTGLAFQWPANCNLGEEIRPAAHLEQMPGHHPSDLLYFKFTVSLGPPKPDATVLAMRETSGGTQKSQRRARTGLTPVEETGKEGGGVGETCTCGEVQGCQRGSPWAQRAAAGRSPKPCRTACSPPPQCVRPCWESPRVQSCGGVQTPSVWLGPAIKQTTRGVFSWHHTLPGQRCHLMT